MSCVVGKTFVGPAEVTDGSRDGTGVLMGLNVSLPLSLLLLWLPFSDLLFVPLAVIPLFLLLLEDTFFKPLSLLGLPFVGAGVGVGR